MANWTKTTDGMMVNLLDQWRTRTVGALALAGVVVLPSLAGCGGDGGTGTGAPRWEDGLTASAAPIPSATQTGPEPTPTVSSAGPTRSTRPPATTSAPANRPRTMAQRSTVTVSLTGGLGQSQDSAGLQQDGCGEPSWALVTIRVGGSGDVRTVEFHYEVRTPVPLSGTRPARSLGGDGESWLGSLGPFRAEPRNAAGGQIVVTAEVGFRDGSERTARTTSTLLPCRR
ncbi:hypothetical protein [Plantactinospora sp. B5E13]|uniref:hypothetical protein n=1 Tax=Plantactinospora sp. B5E13 TaxID=3153758 RepID=UPI00325DF3C7